jgi:apolipoprotein N-acyltransferase
MSKTKPNNHDLSSLTVDELQNRLKKLKAIFGVYLGFAIVFVAASLYLMLVQRARPNLTILISLSAMTVCSIPLASRVQALQNELKKRTGQK